MALLSKLATGISFDLPIDRRQRSAAARALTATGAPFSDDDLAEGAARVWDAYVAADAGGWIDRAIHRRDREEHIDDEALPAERRRALIRSLDRLNGVLGAYAMIRLALAQLLDEAGAPTDRPVTVLDVGSGHGAFPIALARSRRLDGRALRVIGSDLADAYVEEARAAAAAKGVDVEFRRLDATRLADELDEPVDVITCTQTVHHFPPPLVAKLLSSARRAARLGVIFFDARRAPLTLAGIALLAPIISAGDRMFLHDGVVSVRRMYSPAELEMLARCTPGGEAYRATNFGPQYVTLTWSAARAAGARSSRSSSP
jgi:2-polyprenyl-3-methyl-5-hydroxy-6-metoxy-1,4-benzoquinol methylase